MIDLVGEKSNSIDGEINIIELSGINFDINFNRIKVIKLINIYLFVIKAIFS